MSRCRCTSNKIAGRPLPLAMPNSLDKLGSHAFTALWLSGSPTRSGPCIAPTLSPDRHLPKRLEGLLGVHRPAVTTDFQHDDGGDCETQALPRDWH